MLIFLLLLFTVFMIPYWLVSLICNLLYKLKIANLLESINSKEDLLYCSYRDFLSIITEVFKRKEFKVEPTDKCGEESNGLLLNKISFAEIWKHGLWHTVEIETAMKLAKCMQTHSIYRGMLVTLGDFKQNTKSFCHRNVIECINGDQLLLMCKETQKSRPASEPLNLDHAE